MTEYTLTLKPNWMERRGFAASLEMSATDLATQQIGAWAEGMGCLGLQSFLDNRTGGMFLVAGPRGMGKTSHVRNTIRQWQKSHPCDYTPALFLDASDLGVLDPYPNETELERRILTGLMRHLSNRAARTTPPIPTNPPSASWWQKQVPPPPPSLPSDLHDLRDRIEASEAVATFLKDKSEAENQDSKTNLAAEIKLAQQLKELFFAPDVKASAGKSWQKNRLSNKKIQEELRLKTDRGRTDILRMEIKELFYRYPKETWPILVIDEWDRFQSGQETSQDELSAVFPILKSLGRLKSLLNEYPSPVIIIGGPALYHVLRHPDIDPKMSPERFGNIFQHRCFISPPLPRPIMSKERPDANPLRPYLNAMLEPTERPDEEQVRMLADLMLFETGPNPHGMKLFMTRFCQGNIFRYHMSPYSACKALLARAACLEWQRWNQDYVSILSSGSYTRMNWLWYLLDRVRLFWKSVHSFSSGPFTLPDFDLTTIPPPVALLNKLDEFPEIIYGKPKVSLKFMAQCGPLQWQVDQMWILKFRLAYEELKNKPPVIRAPASWQGWKDEELIHPTHGGQYCFMFSLER
ncbi:MAG: hypothetical protein G8345_20115 [Magnetococcales bacterium]|nr:hypothetical protein [Magnetococcales bacterium]NGZ29178.1 hypothetical protein [Magnetococcales bacterium]